MGGSDIFRRIWHSGVYYSGYYYSAGIKRFIFASQYFPEGIIFPENGNTPYDYRKGVKTLNKDKEVQAYLRGELTEEERMKYEIAGELGVLDKVLEGGWKSLSAKETGRIGGLMTRRKKQ